MIRNSIIRNQRSVNIERHRSHRQAFTLIELLCVIAIIAILAAVLFPVFAQAKESAKKTTCLSNQKQISIAFVLYTNDYDDMTPLTNDGGYLPSGNYLAKALLYSVEYDPSFNVLKYSGGILDAYMKAFQLVGCPSTKDLIYWNQMSAKSVGLISIGYDYNVFGSPRNMSDVQEPANTTIFGDSARYHTPAGGAPVEGVYSDQQICNVNFANTVSGAGGVMHARHSGKLVTAWADGHAKSMTLTYRDVEVPSVLVAQGVTKAKLDANKIGWMCPPGLVAASGVQGFSIMYDPKYNNYFSLKKN